MNPARVLVLSVGPALAVHDFLAARGTAPLRDSTEEQHAAELLALAVRCAELLVAYAVALAGRPSRQ